MQYTTEDIMALVRRRDREINNTAPQPQNEQKISINTERDCNTARGINLQYSNIEYSNIASHLAEDSAGDELASLETSSSLGEVKEEGVVVQEDRGLEIAEGAIYNPAQIWGIQVQQLIKKTKRDSFHVTLQTHGQVATQSYNKYTVYTVPHDRLREYKPEGELEQELYLVAQDTPDMSIGRVTVRGRKGFVVDGMLAFTTRQDLQLVLTLLFAHGEQIMIAIDQEPTEYQKTIYSHTGTYGQTITMPGRRKRISFENSLTHSGGCDE